MSFANFWHAHGAEILQLSWQHLELVAVSVAIAVAIGLPVGILLTRYPRLAKPVLAVANIAQTIPSLALFGFLIPLSVSVFGMRLLGGIGPQTAIAALVLYALLPIIRNTWTGIEGVDPAVREAGRAMGMTPMQLLFQVELPLAAGVILAGIRVATVITVGTATIAAAIDAGGLGVFIFRGLRMNDNGLLLAGALPAALIAIAADALLGAIERALKPGGRRIGRFAMATAAAGMVAIAATSWHAPVGDRVVVGCKDFTEQLILGELIAQTIEDKTHLPVVRRFDLAGTLAHQALLAGEIDLYPEYTGTALMAILHHAPMSDPKAVYTEVAQDYQPLGLTWLPPLGFDDTFAILVRGGEASQYHLKTISQLAAVAPRLRAGFGQDFMSRPDGYAGFTKAYGLRFRGRPREMDLALTYQALQDHQVDLIAGNATDGLIARDHLVQLADDRHFFPPYDAAAVARTKFLKTHPDVRAAVEWLSGKLTVDAMRRMNDAVDRDHRDAHAVAAEFLKGLGLKR
ncbi:MAG TPA: ABC transporter permease/substrate-binding protein [Oscillatoriaceae cyanobacterium]